MRLFLLVRSKDISGNSGTGIVAEGVVFSDGQTILKWLKEPCSLGVYKSINHLVNVHGHEGNSQIQFIESPYKESIGQ
jgi:hypothetical protein